VIGSVLGLVGGDAASSTTAQVDALKWGIVAAGVGAVLALVVTLGWLPRRVAEDPEAA
jgi:hypothetical protein